MIRSSILLVVLMSIATVGCTHKLRIVNTDEYFAEPLPPLSAPTTIGVTSMQSGDAETSRYVDAIVDALKRTDSFQRVLYPYKQNVHKGDVSAVIDINVNPQYKGSGSNFFINWPGFLIFAPAIWGYIYYAEIETGVTCRNVNDGRYQEITIPTKYKFRQAEIDRTWTEIGWLEVGIIPLIGGIVFTRYDVDVTGEFIEKVSVNYGTYITKKIREGCDHIYQQRKAPAAKAR